MTKKFESGKSAMAWLLHGEGKPSKSARELEAEIRVETATRIPGTTGKPMAPFPGPRTAKQTRTSAKRSSTAKPGMTKAQFLSSLPPAIDLTGGKSGKLDDLPKRIREECKLAINAGLLPKGTEISVRKNHHASYHVQITAWPGQVFNDKYLEHYLDVSTRDKDFTEGDDERYSHSGRARSRFDNRLTKELNEALVLIDALAERHNYDRSQIETDYFDVGYYMTVDANPVIAAATTGLSLEGDPEYAKLYDQAKLDAKALGPACVKSVCGNKDLRAAGKYCMERLRKIADRAQGRPVFFDKGKHGWYPVDPRSAGLPELKLGRTTYKIASGDLANDIKRGYMSLIGPGGGNTSLIRSVHDTKDRWSHLVGKKTTWYQRQPDGSFVAI
jgi:hypothetical protein